MKKTSTRLASVGGVILLGACAITLAQFDARKRERPTNAIASFPSQSPEPIQASDQWPSGNTVGAQENITATVRANNEQSKYTALSPNDGLPAVGTLSDASGSLYDNSLPGLPSTTPNASATLSDSHPQTPTLPSTSNSSRVQANTIAAHLPQSPNATPPAWLGDERPSNVNPAATNPALSNPSPATSLPNPIGGSNLGTPTATTQTLSDSGSPGAALLPTPTLPESPQLPRLPSTGTSYAPPSGAGLAANPSGISNLPAVDSQPAELPNTLRAGSPSSPGMAAMPSAPSAVNPLPPTVNPAELSAPSSQPSTSGLPTSRVNDMSDTQRPAMATTDLTQLRPEQNPPPALPSRSPNAGPYPGAPTPAPNAGNVVTFGQNGQGRTNNLNSQPPPTTPSNPSFADRPIGMGTSRPSSPNASSAIAAASATGTRMASLSSNQPGQRFLDGAQNPVMVINKRAPEEIQVGKKTTFVIEVENAGRASAHDVIVLDRVPQGVRFIKSVPAVNPNADGSMSWKLGKIGAGEKRTITLEMIPEVQGEIGSVATIQFAAQASMRSLATLPKLELDLQASKDVLLGGTQEVIVTIRNSGTGVARGVMLEADIPSQLQHESGDAYLQAKVGDLRPGESKRVNLFCSAIQPGKANCEVRAFAKDDISAKKYKPIEVRAPELVAAITGPKVRYLERQATYKVAVQNKGTATASNLNFQVHLPSGLKFNAADVHGQYDPNSHTITWGLHELPEGQTAPIEFTVLPIDLGPQVLSFGAAGDLGITAETKAEVDVRGLSELAFTVGQDAGTIEVGSMTTYSVQVTNIGNDSDHNVQLKVDLPKGAKLVSVLNAPVKYQNSGNTITFAPIAEMRNRDQYTYRFQVQHSQPGRQIVRSKLTSSNWPQAVIKEEGTLVYNDQN